MQLTDPSFLRSLRHEASRQSEFFRQRGQPKLAHDWSQIEDAAHLALAKRESLHLILSSEVQKGSILKPCE